MLIGKGEVACEALRKSALGFCLSVDRTAVVPVRVARLLERARNTVRGW
jgi:hypothetical protein